MVNLDSKGVKRCVKSWTTIFWKGFLENYNIWVQIKGLKLRLVKCYGVLSLGGQCTSFLTACNEAVLVIHEVWSKAWSFIYRQHLSTCLLECCMLVNYKQRDEKSIMHLSHDSNFSYNFWKLQWITKNTHPLFFNLTFFPYISGTAWATKKNLHLFISVFKELSAGTEIFQIRWHNQLILAKMLIFQ